MNPRTIVDLADEDQAKEMRDAFYSALHDKVMAHIEAKKMEIAQNMFNVPDATATVVDEPVTSQ